ncbi:MAG TPA: hypothetical protein VMT89_02890, partial [Candidatus Acidoferrales bacterium]|nr:hypothetical protein [Candidatus Acidoferrales bacterium]
MVFSRQRIFAPLLVGVAVLAFALLNHVNPSFLPGDDAIYDQLSARDCADSGHCRLIGAPASLPGFNHGAVWLDFLVAVRLLGGDTETQREAVLGLLALSVATLFAVVWRWLRPSIALPAAMLLVVALSVDTSPSRLVSPSAMIFPSILTAAGLLCYGLSGQRRFLAVSAFALGVGLCTHISSVCLVPALIVITLLGRPQPFRALLSA